MKVIRTHEMDPDSLSEFEKEMCYNGLDCCVTLDVYNGFRPQLDNITASTYDFSKALQAPTPESAKSAEIRAKYLAEIER